MIDVPVLVKDALRDGRRLKNYKIKVYGTGSDADVVDFTIDNATLVTESVKFDERMCSGDVLKFGLCEGTSLEFQYFDHPSINGRRIFVEVDVQYEDSGTLSWYTIPMGYFTVSQCPMQYSTGIYKVTAYNKLKAEYLDAKANDLIKQAFADGVAGCDTEIDISILLEILLNDYQIESEYKMVDYVGYLKIPATEYRINILTDRSRPNTYVIMVQWCAFIREYPSASYIPEDPYYREPDWYYTGYLRWWAPTKKLYETMLGWFNAPEHLDDTVANGNTTVGTLREILSGAAVDDPADYYTFSAEMVAGQGTVTRSELNITPDNVDKENGYSPIIQKLRTPACIGDIYMGSTVRFKMPTFIKEVYSTTPVTQENLYSGGFLTSAEVDTAEERFRNLFIVTDYGVDYLKDENIQVQRRTSPVSGFAITYDEVDSLPDVTLRDLQAALFEVACQYGQIDRVSDLFYGKELNNAWLYPANSLYPANTLYPGGGGLVAERGNKSAYSKLWTDSQGQQSFRNLNITYKGLDENQQEKTVTLTKVINANGTTDYNMTDNWVFKNLVWTEQQISDYADAMIAKLQNVSWIPFEMWAAGLPYLETGDEIEITNSEGTYKSYVLQRVLSGIQNLQDTYINGTLEIF